MMLKYRENGVANRVTFDRPEEQATMKSMLMFAAGMVLTLALSSNAHAQYYYGRSADYNPWTGGSAYGAGYANPWTGGGYYGGGVVNPWGGATTAVRGTMRGPAVTTTAVPSPTPTREHSVTRGVGTTRGPDAMAIAPVSGEDDVARSQRLTKPAAQATVTLPSLALPAFFPRRFPLIGR